MSIQAERLPARVSPPPEPLSTINYFRTVVRNPLEVWPEAIYRDPVYAERFMGAQTLFVMDPDLVEQMLVGEPERYRKSDMMMRLQPPASAESAVTMTMGPAPMTRPPSPGLI